MKVISVINYKGGVGKTTLTANLGAYAASVGKRVLLIDLDPQTHLTFNFMTVGEWSDRYSENKTMRNFFEPVRRRENLPSLSSLIISINNGFAHKINLLSSHLELIDIDVNLSSLLSGNDEISLAANYMYGVSCLSKALESLKSLYDIVLIDCPPNFNLIVKSAIFASDYYIVPTKLDYLSTMGIKYLVYNLEKYQDICNKYINRLHNPEYKPMSIEMLGVVPTMVNIWRGTEPQKAQQEYLMRLKKEYRVFQFIRNNSEMFGVELRDKYGRVVPTVLAHLKADTTKVKIKGELKNLCEDFLRALYV